MKTFKAGIVKNPLSSRHRMPKSELERRLRRELRLLRFEGDALFLINTGSVECRVLERLLANIFGKRVEIRRVPKDTRKRKNVFAPTSLENELVRELRNFLEDEDETNRFTPLMATVPEDMVLAYAKRHRLPGKTLAPEDGVRALLEALQQTQPQTKASLRKSFDHLRKSFDHLRKASGKRA